MSLKELEKLLKLCRKQGVESLRYNDIELHLGPMPTSPAKRQRKVTQQPIPGAEAFSMPDIDTPDELTEEQMLMWSAGGQPNQQ